MAEPRYVLDANVFIEAARRYYAFDLAPRFWHSLTDHAGTGRICSIDRVKDELVRGKDELADWAKTEFSHGFCSTDENEVVESLSEMMEWVQRQKQFTDFAKAEFASVADGWIVAYASVNRLIVVTHEEFAPDVKKKVPIPNVCNEFGVKYTDTFEMLRVLKVQFR